jgi:hypothetical protein
VKAGITAVAGGTLVVAGAILPWLSFFAGLQSYSGMVGLYGRLLFAGGALAVVAGVVIVIGSIRWLRPGVGALGLLLALFTSWLLLGLRSTTRELSGHPLLVARAGPGLFVALVGALAIAGLLVPGRRGLGPGTVGEERDGGQ